MNQICAAISAMTLLLFFSACQRSDATSATPPTVSEPAAHDDDHDHETDSHSHAETGPRGGHLLVLSGDYQAEWLHDDATGLLTVYLVAKDAQSKEPTPAKKVTLEVTIGGNTRTYELQLASAEESTSVSDAAFSIKDRSLVEALKAVGHGVEAVLIAEVADQTLRGHFEHLDHDHGHAH